MPSSISDRARPGAAASARSHAPRSLFARLFAKHQAATQPLPALRATKQETDPVRIAARRAETARCHAIMAAPEAAGPGVALAAHLAFHSGMPVYVARDVLRIAATPVASTADAWKLASQVCAESLDQMAASGAPPVGEQAAGILRAHGMATGEIEIPFSAPSQARTRVSGADIIAADTKRRGDVPGVE